MASEQEILNTLAKLISGQSGSGMFDRGDSGPRDESARAKEAGKIISEKISSGMEKSIKNLPKHLSEAIDQSSSNLAKEIAGSTKKIQDVLRVEDQVTAMKHITNELTVIGDREFASKDDLAKELDKLERVAQSAGMSLKKLGIETKVSSDTLNYSINNSAESIDDLTEATDALEEALESTRTESNKLEKATETVKNSFSSLGRILKEAANIALEEIRLSSQRATADQGLITGIRELGISQIQYGKILADTRQEQFAMQAAGENFQENLTENSRRLQHMTASNEEAAQANVMLMKISARMGVTQSKLGNAIGDQITMYEKNARAYGMSVVEVAKLTESLMGENDFRLEMVRMRESERKQFILGIAQRQKEYKAMGFTQERAMQLQKTFAALAAMNPKERMKQAAKKRAMMGALGLGAEGAELMDLEVRYQYATGEQKEKMGKRMAQIQSQASGAFLEKTGAGADIGSAMAMGQLAYKTGFNDVVNTFETESGKGLKHQEASAASLNNISKNLSGMKIIYDYVDAAKKSAVGSAAVGGLGMAGSMISSMAGGLVAALGTAAIGAVAAPLAAAVLAGVGAVGVGYAINEYMKSNDIDSIFGFSLSDPATKKMRQAEEYAKSSAGQAEAAQIKEREAYEQTPEYTAELRNTLKDLQKYMKSLNDQNSDQADALRKTASAIEEDIEKSKFGKVSRAS